jgi:hypothetical protein
VRRGVLLEAITAGFCRFWLTTDMRRALWSGTSVAGHALEYTGTAKELLLGFLFALVILAPIYLVYFLIGIELGRVKAFATCRRASKARGGSCSSAAGGYGFYLCRSSHCRSLISLYKP